MKIIKNPKWTDQEHKNFLQKITENDGYCPCSLIKTPETKCMCSEFLNMKHQGECHCGRFIKTEV